MVLFQLHVLQVVILNDIGCLSSIVSREGKVAPFNDDAWGSGGIGAEFSPSALS